MSSPCATSSEGKSWISRSPSTSGRSSTSIHAKRAELPSSRDAASNTAWYSRHEPHHSAHRHATSQSLTLASRRVEPKSLQVFAFGKMDRDGMVGRRSEAAPDLQLRARIGGRARDDLLE